jgi:predicted RecA/RadA family phage recombinase
MVSAQFVQPGATVDYRSDVDVPLGAVIVQGDLVGVAVRPIPAGTLGVVAVEGVFDIAKDLAASIAAGAKVYWDATASQAVTVATGNKQLGKAIAAAGANTSTVRTRLSQ